MKKFIICAVVAVFAMFFASCEKEEVTGSVHHENVSLNIQPDIAGVSVTTRAAISSFPTGATVGLFVTSGALGSDYNGVSVNSNVKSVLSGSIWTQTPAVYLSSADATVYAYYPYSSSNGDGSAIPVDHASQNDFMYGTHTSGQPSINNGNPNVNLTMNHALTLLQFKISRSNYTGAGVVTTIDVANAAGKTCIYSNGTLNIATGVITNTCLLYTSDAADE